MEVVQATRCGLNGHVIVDRCLAEAKPTSVGQCLLLFDIFVKNVELCRLSKRAKAQRRILFRLYLLVPRIQLRPVSRFTGSKFRTPLQIDGYRGNCDHYKYETGEKPGCQY